MEYLTALNVPDADLITLLGPFSLPPSGVQTLTVHIAGCHPDQSLLHATLVHEAAIPDVDRSQVNWITFDWGSLCVCTN